MTKGREQNRPALTITAGSGKWAPNISFFSTHSCFTSLCIIELVHNGNRAQMTLGL